MKFSNLDHEIQEMKKVIDQHYKIWEEIILKGERNKAREERKDHILDEFELEQESYEISQLEDIRKQYQTLLPLYSSSHKREKW